VTPRRSRPTRDPDRRPTPPKHPGFAQFPLDVDTDVCARCRALIPATELARMKHQEWDERIDAAVAWLATSALTEQLTKMVDPGPPPGSGSAPMPGAGAAGGGTGDASAGRGPAPGTTSGVGEAGVMAYPGRSQQDPAGRGPVGAAERPAPGTKTPPTPSPEVRDEAGRGGVEGANQSTVPPDPIPPGPGGANPDDDPWWTR
jgi:hypothetical protein